jgi:glycosyltransferase involved in cell wall biosynthesis
VTDHARVADVTIVVPVYNGARYLRAALDSVLTQDPAPREVVVVDDGSTDDTAAVMSEYADRIVAVHRPHAGYSPALNTGIEAATSTWVSFVDADDEWTPTSMADRWAAIDADPAVELVAGRTVQFLSPELPPEVADRYVFDDAPSRGHVLGATIVRRSTLHAVGRLDDSHGLTAAIDWMSRAMVAGVPTVEIDAVVLRRRIHGTNVSITTDHDARLKGLRDVVRAHHARRRGQETS